MVIRAVRPPRVVGVCTLTTRELAAELREAPGVAVAGPLMTANLGIEELVRSVLRDRTIGVLVVCGRDSALFQQGQSLIALAANGVRAADRRIVGAAGHKPFLAGLSVSDVSAFRSQVRVVDLRGVVDVGRLRSVIASLAVDAGSTVRSCARPRDRRFTVLRPVGRRTPIAAAGEGFFVISVSDREIVVRHYRDDFSAGHEMRGRRAESMVLGLLRAGLVSDPSHTAYLGAELAKAETALRLGLDYVQDIPLRRRRDALEGNMRSIADFTGYLAGLLEVDTLSYDAPIGDQVEVDSSRMIELAIALEQECGLDLDDDIDLRQATPAELFAGVPREAAS